MTSKGERLYEIRKRSRIVVKEKMELGSTWAKRRIQSISRAIPAPPERKAAINILNLGEITPSSCMENEDIILNDIENAAPAASRLSPIPIPYVPETPIQRGKPYPAHAAPTTAPKV